MNNTYEHVTVQPDWESGESGQWSVFLSWFSNQKISGNNFIIIEIGHKNNFWYFLNFQKDFQILNFPIPVF